MDNVITTTKQKMQKSFEVLQQDFATVRTGKANPALVENITVQAYEGTWLRIMELATVAAQDAQTLTIIPYDKSVISKIQKGIEDAEIGISPVQYGDMIRISLPPLTEERRRDMVKLINQKAENGRIMMRQVRHEAMEEIKKMKENDAPEDEVSRLEKEVQKQTDEFIKKMDAMRDEKEADLMRL